MAVEDDGIEADAGDAEAMGSDKDKQRSQQSRAIDSMTDLVRSLPGISSQRDPSASHTIIPSWLQVPEKTIDEAKVKKVRAMHHAYMHAPHAR